MAAARDLTKGELILRVPKTALFTTECLLKSDQKLSLAVNRHLFLSPSQVFFFYFYRYNVSAIGIFHFFLFIFLLLSVILQILIVCFLYEVGKGKSSRWYTYLMLLPRCYEILATFGPFEKQALQVQFLYSFVIWK